MGAILLTFTLTLGFTTASIFIVLFFYPDNVKKWVSNIAWVLSRIWNGLEYIAIKNEIEGKLNSFIGNLSTQTTVDFPEVSIKWAGRDEKEELIFDDLEVVIVMHDRKYRYRNFVHAAYFFVSETLLKRTKNHLSPNLKKSLDLFATKEILEKEGMASIEQFINDYINPEVERSEDIKMFLRQFNGINKIGIFFPILIQELTRLGNKTLLSTNNKEAITEVKRLIDFLETLSNRKVGEKAPEAFFGDYMRCAVKIVASWSTREARKVDPQVERISLECKRGCENIYVMGSAKEDSKEFIEDVIEKALTVNKSLQVIKRLSFTAEVFIGKERKEVQDYFVHVHNPTAIKYLYE